MFLSLAVMIETTTARVRKSIVVNENNLLQNFHGCGASLTDSSAWLLEGTRNNPSTDPRNLSETEKSQIYSNLFSSNGSGIGLRIVRQPMGTSDFRWSDYTYEDTQGRFSISRDTSYIIPSLIKAKNANPDLLIHGVPWSPPAWMKNPESLNGGSMKSQQTYYDAYGEYFADYVEAYDNAGLSIWAVSAQNEPQHAVGEYPTMIMTSTEHAQLIKAMKFSLNSRGYSNVKVVAYEHNWNTPSYPLEVLSDPDAKAALMPWHFIATAVNPPIKPRCY